VRDVEAALSATSDAAPPPARPQQPPAAASPPPSATQAPSPLPAATPAPPAGGARRPTRRDRRRCPASIAADARYAFVAMSEPTAPQDGGPQETFISHLIELRSRLLRSIVAVVIVLVCLVPWAKDIYAALAAPL
jgi:hypothetical protein